MSLEHASCQSYAAGAANRILATPPSPLWVPAVAVHWQSDRLIVLIGFQLAAVLAFKLASDEAGVAMPTTCSTYTAVELN